MLVILNLSINSMFFYSQSLFSSIWFLYLPNAIGQNFESLISVNINLALGSLLKALDTGVRDIFWKWNGCPSIQQILHAATISLYIDSVFGSFLTTASNISITSFTEVCNYLLISFARVDILGKILSWVTNTVNERRRIAIMLTCALICRVSSYIL